MTKLLAICIPTYNRAQFLNHSLNELLGEVDRYHLEDEVEVLVSDNQSTDQTRKILQEYQKRYSYLKTNINRQNIGLAGNVVKLYQLSRAKYTWILSDDDFLIRGQLPRLLKQLKQKQPGVCYANYQPVNTFFKGSSAKVKTIHSIILPGFPLKTNRQFTHQEFLRQMSVFGFFGLRILIGQLSSIIMQTKFLQTNLRQITKNKLARAAYPHSWVLWHSYPKDSTLCFSNPLIYVTVNNRSWNFDVLKANEVVRQEFDPIIKMILKRYRLLSLKVKILLSASLIYSQLIPVVYRLSKLLGLTRQIDTAQFGTQSNEV